MRVLREDKTIYEGKRCHTDMPDVLSWDLPPGSVNALRQLKKEVTEVRKGSECGVNLQDFDNLQEGDVIQTFQKIEMPGEL